MHGARCELPHRIMKNRPTCPGLNINSIGSSQGLLLIDSSYRFIFRKNFCAHKHSTNREFQYVCLWDGIIVDERHVSKRVRALRVFVNGQQNTSTPWFRRKMTTRGISVSPQILFLEGELFCTNKSNRILPVSLMQESSSFLEEDDRKKVTPNVINERTTGANPGLYIGTSNVFATLPRFNLQRTLLKRKQVTRFDSQISKHKKRNDHDRRLFS